MGLDKLEERGTKALDVIKIEDLLFQVNLLLFAPNSYLLKSVWWKFVFIQLPWNNSKLIIFQLPKLMESISLVTEFANKKVLLSHQTTQNLALQTVNNSSRCAGWTAKVLVITMKLGRWERCSSKCRPQTSSKGNQSNYVAKWTGLAMTIDYGWANIHLLAVIKVGNWINAKLRAAFLQRKEVALTSPFGI